MIAGKELGRDDRVGSSMRMAVAEPGPDPIGLAGKDSDRFRVAPHPSTEGGTGRCR